MNVGNTVPVRYFITMMLLVAFVAGFMVMIRDGISSNNCCTNKTEGMENMCPTLLIKTGGKLKLLDASSNVTLFDDMSHYEEYLDDQRKQGLTCPTLFAQEENSAEGSEVYMTYPSAFQVEGGLQRLPINSPKAPNPFPTPFSTKDQDYPGFDPYGLSVGRMTDLDKVHASTQQVPVSENPMDPNWGGVPVTQEAVDAGKYADNEIVKPVLRTPVGVPPRMG